MYPQGYGELFAPFDAHITIVAPARKENLVAQGNPT
jgi:hypothetical protein